MLVFFGAMAGGAVAAIAGFIVGFYVGYDDSKTNNKKIKEIETRSSKNDKK